MKQENKKAIIIISTILLVVILTVNISFTVACADKALKESDFIKRNDGFYVENNKLYDANGNEFVMRGINFPHAWFTAYDEISLNGIKQTGANCVRVVCGSGDKYNKDTVESLNTVICACKERKLVSIFEAHDVTGSNDPEDLFTVVDFWIENKEAFVGQEKYCIINIANEWMSSADGKAWRDAYVEALKRLRSAGIKNTVMIDAVAYGQNGDSVANFGADIFRADELRNTVFSVHLYQVAGKSPSTIRNTLNKARNNNLCVVVGEFGYKNVDEEYIMKYCAENYIGWLGWSWKGNGHGAEYLDIAEDWAGEALSKDWGETLVNGKYGIKQTSKTCAVFD